MLKRSIADRKMEAFVMGRDKFTWAGRVWPPEISTRPDRVTGSPILQVTNHPSINHPTYFLQSSFLPDGSGMIFTSYRTGSPQLFEASLRTARYATHGRGSDSSFLAGNLWREAFISCAADPSGGSIATRLSKTEIIRFDNAQLGECSLSADGEWITAAIKQGAQAGIVTGRADGTGLAIDSFRANGDSSAVSSARTGVADFRGRSRAANVSRAARWIRNGMPASTRQR